MTILLIFEQEWRPNIHENKKYTAKTVCHNREIKGQEELKTVINKDI